MTCLVKCFFLSSLRNAIPAPWRGRERLLITITVTPLQTLYPQIVLFGDSLFQAAGQLSDGFSLQAALQSR